MKRAVIVSFLILASVLGYSQTYTAYYHSFGDRIPITAIKSGRGEIIVSIQYYELSVPKSQKTAILIHGEKKVSEFISALYQLRQKYSEWRRISMDNRLVEIVKEVPTDFPVVMTAVGAYIKPQWIFMADDRYIRPYVLCLGIVEDTFGNESYYGIAFYGPEEIDEMISALDIDKINRFFSTQKGARELLR